MAGEGSTTAPVTAFSLGISSEQKLGMPLDALISAAKKEKKASAAKSAKPQQQNGTKPQNEKKIKKGTAGTQAVDTKRKQQNVKKTVSVPVSKKERAKASQAASSLKRQAVVNKRRTGLAPAATNGKKTVSVQLRRRPTSALRAAQSIKKSQVKGKKTMSGGLDVSNIVQHFRTHPTKFDLPKGTNLRITINLNNVKPVVGGKK